jgi:hypothetical protein
MMSEHDFVVFSFGFMFGSWFMNACVEWANKHRRCSRCQREVP